MNLLFLASWYPESKDSRNGLFIWQHAVAVAKHSSHQVSLVAAVAATNTHKLFIRQERMDGVEHWVAIYPKTSNPLLRSWRYLWALHKAITAKEKASGKADLLVVNVLWRAGLLAWIYHLLRSRPYIIIEHWSGYLPEGQGYNGFYLKYFTRLIADRAERILAVSNHLANSMRARGLANRYHVLPNIIQTEIFKTGALKSDTKPLRLLHVSNLAAEKNFDFVVQIWQKLQRTHPETELMVAGAYAEADQKRFSNHKGIQWLGFQDAAQLASVYHSATVLCMPSQFETFSIVIGEALACGCAVVAADLPTFDFYKKATQFYSFPLSEPDSWAKAILKIYENRPETTDFEFINNNFSDLKVSEKMVSIIEGIDL